MAGRRQQVDDVRDGVELTSLDSELYDGAGATKRELVDYLDAIADLLVPQLAGRPLTVMRARGGQQPFMQKNLPKHAPQWIPNVEIWSNASQRMVRYPFCADRRTLLWFANQRAVEFHPTLLIWPDRVDCLLIDLDPPEQLGFDAVITAAMVVRQVLDRWQLPSVIKTSGSKGVHIAVPVTGVDIDDAAAATRALAEQVARADPSVATTQFLRSERGERVFVDSSRAGGASVASVWSPRVRPGLPVSFPVAWERLSSIAPGQFTLRTALNLLPQAGPWAEAFSAPVAVPEELITRGREIPSGRVQAMNTGKRRKRGSGS